MDGDSSITSQELSYREFLDQNNNGSRINGVDGPWGCGLCGRSMSLEDEMNGVHQIDGVCDDCKFLLIEDFGTPARNWSRRRLSGRSRSIYGGSDSTENLFSQQFSQIINLARHDEPGHEDTLPSSSHTTPDGSRTWQRIISETESDVSNSDSYYGESESNISYGAYYHGDNDALSFTSTFEGDSDISVGGHTFFNTDIVQSVDRSDLDSDSDIDPMRAGNVQWDLDNEWQEVDNEEDAVELSEVRSHIDTLVVNSFRRRAIINPPESLEMIRWRISEATRQIHGTRIGMEEPIYVGDPGNYLDARGFEEYMEHIGEIDRPRCGAPPASTSFVNNLPSIIISEEHQRPDGLACAICKDLLTSGTKVNQLPCLHLYHPVCISPWLSTRNTCPLCRYELPTDKTEYDHGTGIANLRTSITEMGLRDDNSSIMTDSSEMEELQGPLEDVGPVSDISLSRRGRGGWLLFAAAPLVSIMGIVFVLWLGNPLAGRARGQVRQSNFHCQPADLIQSPDSCPYNERGRRWWWF